MIRFRRRSLPLLLAAIVTARSPFAAGQEPAQPAAPPPDEFPRFVVPGHERHMSLLRELYWRHYQPAGPLIPLWDEWLPKSTLWPARGGGAELRAMRDRWAGALAARAIDDEGYVHTQQHDGPAHSAGWPFPSWALAGGIGWHFAPLGVPGYEPPLATTEGWKLTAARSGPPSDKGWVIELTDSGAVAESPPVAVEARAAPWLRLNWWAGDLGRSDCYVEWTTKDHPSYSADRRIYFARPATDQVHAALPPSPSKAGTQLAAAAEGRTMIAVHRIPGWKGTITGFRIGFANAGPSRVVIKSFHTACDTRHSINNPNFIRGCHDYFVWSRDLAFLRGQIARVRQAMRFTMREFDTRRRKCVYTTWPGHEGRSGVRWIDGKKVVTAGEGIGSNYWDLLPFGGEDALATIYYYDALRDLAALEELVAAHPQWNIPGGIDAFDPADLRQHAREVREFGTRRFWNDKTGRFGTVDLDGNLHDYGFTFLNNEAVYHDFATAEQAQAIHAWMSGRRLIEGDTATGKDIYRWRFGPRSTTRRNIDYYFWGWSGPEQIPWGNQVQDGGAVLGFSYHDLMARLKTAGPDDAWQRLREILDWFAEVQTAGGYRQYYSDPARGTLQGSNVPGGLGLDKEFFESIMVPQVMLYGFLGFQATADGCTIDPRLPADWTELGITRIHLHDHVLDIRVDAKTIHVTDHNPASSPLAIKHSSQRKLIISSP